jgi:hypothetical protein
MRLWSTSLLVRVSGVSEYACRSTVIVRSARSRRPAHLRTHESHIRLLANIRKRGTLNRPAERHDQADVFEGRRVASATRRR